MSADHMAAWRWWQDEANKSDILAMPNCGGGLACYRDQHGELVLLTHDYHGDDNDMLCVPPYLVRPLIEKMVELFPELVDAPRPPLLIQPPRQLAIAGPRLAPRPGELPFAQAAE